MTNSPDSPVNVYSKRVEGFCQVLGLDLDDVKVRAYIIKLTKAALLFGINTGLFDEDGDVDVPHVILMLSDHYDL